MRSRDEIAPLTHTSASRPLRRPDLRRQLRKPVRVSVAGLLWLGAISGGIGFSLGHVNPYGDKRMQLMEGQARLHNKQNWLTSVDDPESSQQLAFHAESVHWSAASLGSGEGVPPCLVVGRDVPVEVGYTWFALPGGGSRQMVVWVRCL